MTRSDATNLTDPYWVEQSYSGYPYGGDTQSIVATFTDEGDAKAFASTLQAAAPRGVRVVARKADQIRSNPDAADFTLLTTWDLNVGPLFDPSGFHLSESQGAHIARYPEFVFAGHELAVKIADAPERVLLSVNDDPTRFNDYFTLDAAPAVFMGLASDTNLLTVGNIFVTTDRTEHLIDMGDILPRIDLAMRGRHKN